MSRWQVLTQSLVPMVGFLCGAVAQAEAIDEIVVSRSTPTSNIVNNEPASSLSQPIVLAPGPAWYFSELVVQKTVLDRMRAEGRLPIKHVWYRVIGSSVSTDAPDFSYDLSVGDASALPDLEREVYLRGGYYDWRTASCRKNLKRGTYRIVVTDRLGNRIACSSNQCFTDMTVNSGGTTASPC